MSGEVIGCTKSKLKFISREENVDMWIYTDEGNNDEEIDVYEYVFNVASNWAELTYVWQGY